MTDGDGILLEMPEMKSNAKAMYCVHDELWDASFFNGGNASNCDCEMFK